MGKETPDWCVALMSVRGEADVQSLIHPSLMPGLVTRAVSCLGHIKKNNLL